MKIGIVSPYDVHRPGGVQAHMRDVAATLDKLGHAVKLLAPGPAPAGASADGIIHIGRHRGVNFNQTRFEVSFAGRHERRTMRELLRREAFDVLHFHTVWTPLLPFQILRASTSANVATFHDTPPETLGGRLTRRAFRALSRRLAPRLEAMIAVSAAPAAHLVAAPERPLHILPPCTDLSPYFAGAAPVAALRDERVNILYLGRLDRRKGVYQLLQAYRRLSREARPVRLILAGGGEEMPELRRIIAAEGLAEVVVLGPVEEAEKPRIYASADIFCSPALHGESFGIVLVEAMASGKPVVAAANSGFRTVLTGEAARFLAPPGDVEALAGRLRLLIGDEDLRRRMGAWGREQARQYDCARVVPQLVEIYRQALALKG